MIFFNTKNALNVKRVPINQNSSLKHPLSCMCGIRYLEDHQIYEGRTGRKCVGVAADEWGAVLRTDDEEGKAGEVL